MPQSFSLSLPVGGTRALASGARVTRTSIGYSLIAAEVAMALLVITGAALLTRSFAAILDENPGFRAQGVWVVPNMPLHRSFETSPPFLSNQLLPAVRSVAGVQEAAAKCRTPQPRSHGSQPLRDPLRPGGPHTFKAGNYPVGQTRWITPGYFAALPGSRSAWAGGSRSRMRRPAGSLINETLAHRFFPNQDPVGRHLVLGVMDTGCSRSPKLSALSGTSANSAWT